MNLRDLEYLVALDEHRHFGRAAAACYASQPTLSTQLRKLEHELGVSLIERGGRTVLFTAAGEQVVARARKILAEVEDIRRVARQSADPRAGTLRLGAFPTLGPYLLPHVMPLLHRQLPELEVLLVEEKTADLLHQVHTGAIDVAVLALPIEDDSLHVEPLFHEEFLLAAPVDSDLGRDAGPVSAAELAGHDLLLLTEGHCLRDQALSFCRTQGVAERDGFQATSLETLRHMVASGVGATLMPRLSVSPPVTVNPGLALREFEPPAPFRDIAMVWRKASVQGELFTEVADVFRQVPTELVSALAPEPA
ncbi:LysR substrate-binding domain-containing protein [Granulicoccus phenolivorans]|uniref:LysR substrate-binding domain-containing protein n=1 Tax=Granulicoccus phenolivorans TaxID=266854 RepID=UPI00041F9302|nr:LysR substrate-binding domain-containing protein [Granulicoccus phenolivorans]